jgi:hypothetical protein
LAINPLESESNADPLSSRCESFVNHVERAGWSKRLDAYIRDELAVQRPIPWLGALLDAIDTISIPRHERKAWIGPLARAAENLLNQDARRDEARARFYQAMRQLGGLATGDQITHVLTFLEKPDIAVRQAVAQAAANIFSRSVDARSRGTRVVELAQKYCDPDIILSPESTALAASFYVAAVLTDQQGGVNLTDALSRRGDDVLNRACVRGLRRYEASAPFVSAHVQRLTPP